MPLRSSAAALGKLEKKPRAQENRGLSQSAQLSRHGGLTNASTLVSTPRWMCAERKGPGLDPKLLFCSGRGTPFPREGLRPCTQSYYQRFAAEAVTRKALSKETERAPAEADAPSIKPMAAVGPMPASGLGNRRLR
jgi:hypothetical protein